MQFLTHEHMLMCEGGVHIISKAECMCNVCRQGCKSSEHVFIFCMYRHTSRTRSARALHMKAFISGTLLALEKCFDTCLIWQVNFAYKEAGESKQALVKLRLCPKHALQLNYKQNEQLLKKRKRDHSSAEKTADARENVEGVSKHDAASPDNGAHKYKVRSERKGKGGGESDTLLDELFM